MAKHESDRPEQNLDEIIKEASEADNEVISHKSTAFLPDLTDDELRKLDEMPREGLISLIQRMFCQCGLVAAMSEEETAQAMLDTLAHTALKPIVAGISMKADIQSRMTAIDKWLDRTKGKPAQSIIQTGTIDNNMNFTIKFVGPNNKLIEYEG